MLDYTITEPDEGGSQHIRNRHKTILATVFWDADYEADLFMGTPAQRLALPGSWVWASRYPQWETQYGLYETREEALQQAIQWCLAMHEQWG